MHIIQVGLMTSKRTQSETARNRKVISIRHSYVHNLKGVSADIPRNALTVVTGVSGSGKSSLAFDTLYAEGQRRFAESLSAYARQFLERMNKPDVESISGLPPAIAIEQRGFSRNPRSTVGTTTEVYDYLRLLYGRIGTVICKCGEIVRKDTPQSAAQRVAEFAEGNRLYITFPILSNSAEKTDERFAKLLRLGYSRTLDVNTLEISDLQDTFISRENLADKAVLADRVIVENTSETISRLTETLESALMHGDGYVTVINITSGEHIFFSSLFECAKCRIPYIEPEPRLFSFNSPFGACPTCQGFGRSIDFDENLVIPNKSRSIRNGAIAPFRSSIAAEYQTLLINSAKEVGISITIPYSQLTKEQQYFIWNGGGEGSEYGGVAGFFAELEKKASYKMHYRAILASYRQYTRCPGCGGARLRTAARSVYVNGKTLPEISAMTIEKAAEFFRIFEPAPAQEAIAGQILKELRRRLQLLDDIGLGYITLDRLSHTLSGGEAQRINLATALGSSLVGTLYVLDEPSIGLHSRDTARLVNLLKNLRSMGNTVVVVEHDPEIIAQADYIIDIGPNAGEQGGNIVFAGSREELATAKKSLTAQYMRGEKIIEPPSERNSGNGLKITFVKPSARNLDIEKVEIPLGCMTVVTGVSGSGKSTLVYDVIYANLRKITGLYADSSVGNAEYIDGASNINFTEMVDQQPIGASSRSTPVTYTKSFDAIRELFAETPEAKHLGWKAGHFSFNVPGGRCETCEGNGQIMVEMQFLPDISLECEVCKGTRYRREARKILYKGKSIIDVLEMTVDEALEFFALNNRIAQKLQILADVGLGYLRLGQPASMLSGGEAQRIKLASFLDTDTGGAGLFIFDEPTTGLHLDDIAKLLRCFRKLIEKKHTVLIVEHNLHLIAAADYIIDLGPEAGALGGKIVASGTPENIADCEASYTGNALRAVLSKKHIESVSKNVAKKNRKNIR